MMFLGCNLEVVMQQKHLQLLSASLGCKEMVGRRVDDVGTAQLHRLHCLQLVIMMTPVRTFFHVRSQTWLEWVFAVGVGAGCMPLSLFIKLGTRLFTAERRRSRATVEAL